MYACLRVLLIAASGFFFCTSVAADVGIPSNKEYRMRVSLFEALDSHPDIVIRGDSLTARGEWLELLPWKSVANRGVGGDTTRGVLARLESVIEMKPKVVFILVGVNDVAKGARASEVIDNYELIIKSLVESGAQVVVQSTLYVSRSSRFNNGVIAEVNEGVEKYCVAVKGCRYVDLNASLSEEGFLKKGYTGDGVHLNGWGYVAWAKVIAPVVRLYVSGR